MNLKRVLIPLVTLVTSIPLFAGTNDLLSIVPTDAVSVGVVRIDQLKGGELGGMLFEETSDITTDGEAMMFLQEAGLNPMSDVDSLLFAMLPREGDPSEGEFLFLVDGRFDPVRLSSAVTRRGAVPAAAGGTSYFTIEKKGEHDGHHAGRVAAVSFPSSTLAIAGTEAAVVEALEILQAGGSDFLAASNIGRDLGAIDRDASAWAMMDVQRSARMGRSMTRKLHEDHAQNFGKAMRYVSMMGVWGSERDGNMEFGGVALSSDEETRVLLEDVVRGITAAWRMTAREENPEWLRVIRSFEIGRDDAGVNITGSIPLALIRDQKRAIASR
ncbi:MAG: hypothetical protein R3338_05445 [Thermoanaerobaculia bacterium]|nr:hypothetical protein [Thermoanaerobaculia bacterium]